MTIILYKEVFNFVIRGINYRQEQPQRDKNFPHLSADFGISAVVSLKQIVTVVLCLYRCLTHWLLWNPILACFGIRIRGEKLVAYIY